MINIKELSVGNWIKISGTPVQILGIRTESLLYVLETEEVDYAYAIDADIEPIEITPEILEKNGFEYNDMPFIQGWEQFGLTLYHGGNGYLINYGQNVAMKINAVHQLQNALTLCGINKEIKL